jgi:hypothetical protein
VDPSFDLRGAPSASNGTGTRNTKSGITVWSYSVIASGIENSWHAVELHLTDAAWARVPILLCLIVASGSRDFALIFKTHFVPFVLENLIATGNERPSW